MCKLCETNPVYEFTNQRKLCKNCFIYWFNKKFLYTLRKYKMIAPQEKIAYENKKDFRGVTLEENLNQFGKKAGIILLKAPTKKNYDKLAIPSSLDEESYKFIEILLNNKTNTLNDLSPVNKKEIYPLYLFLDKEIKLYADLKNLSYKKIKTKKSEWEKFIDKLEEVHPEIKQAIMQSYLKIAGRV